MVKSIDEKSQLEIKIDIDNNDDGNTNGNSSNTNERNSDSKSDSNSDSNSDSKTENNENNNSGDEEQVNDKNVKKISLNVNVNTDDNSNSTNDDNIQINENDNDNNNNNNNTNDDKNENKRKRETNSHSSTYEPVSIIYKNSIIDINSTQTKNWTLEEEEFLTIFSEHAYCYSWVHDKCHKHFRKYNNIVKVPPTLISLMIGAFMFGSLNNEITDVSKITTGSLCLIASLLTGTREYFDHSKKSFKHKSLSIEFLELYKKVVSELESDVEMRHNSKEFVSFVRIEYNRLLCNSNSIEIPRKILELFDIKFKNVDINKPDIGNSSKTNVFYRTPIRSANPSIKRKYPDIPDIKIDLCESNLSPLSRTRTIMMKEYNTRRLSITPVSKSEVTPTSTSKSDISPV